MPARPLKFTRYYLTQWTSKLPGSFGIHWVRKKLVNAVLFKIKDQWTSEITVKLRSNLCIRHVNILANFWQWNMLCLGEVCRLPTQNYVVELWFLYYALNSLAPGRPGHNSKSMILKLIMQNNSLGTYCVIALQWMSQKLTDEKSTLAQVMAWCLSQCWTLFMSPYGVYKVTVS